VTPINASWTNTIGAPELGTVGTDPDFDPRLRAFYYARLIEIPAPLETQQRAYFSPIGCIAPNGMPRRW
jgi:hypothetical protein